MRRPTTLCVDYTDICTEEIPQIDSIIAHKNNALDLPNIEHVAIAHHDSFRHLHNDDHKKIRLHWKKLDSKMNIGHTSARAELVTHPTRAEHIIIATGMPHELLHYVDHDTFHRSEIEIEIQQEIARGRSALGIAHKEQMGANITDDSLHGLAYTHTIFLHYPLRKEWPMTQHVLAKNNVILRIFSKDSKEACKAIARESGINSFEEYCITGNSIAVMSDDELKSILPYTRIFSELQDADKIRIARLLESCGEIVATAYDDCQR